MIEYVFRGYGQLFLCNRVITGVLFFAALLVVSPEDALWSLAGAVIATAVAMRLAPTPWIVKSGLFGVNGALLGYVWISFPEVPPIVRGIVTIGGSVTMALAMGPVANHLRKKQSPFCVFSLPYMPLVWVSLFLLVGARWYSPHLSAGWTALSSASPGAAAQQFCLAEVTTPRARSYRHDGLGWADFRMQAYDQARVHFARAIALSPDFADPYDGLGWSDFRLGRLHEAEAAFRSAVDRDPWLADSWDGLGWTCLLEVTIDPPPSPLPILGEGVIPSSPRIGRRGQGDEGPPKRLLLKGNRGEAQRCFERAALSAPLLADAYSGLGQVLLPAAVAGRPNAAGAHPTGAAYRSILETGVCKYVSSVLNTHLAQQRQYLSTRQIICWLLLFLGILCHSRISALFAAAGVGICLVGAQLLPGFAGSLTDLAFVYNLVALLIALGGQYLRLDRVTLGWMALVTVGLAWWWQGWLGPLENAGSPLLCVPFNVILLGTLAFFTWLRRSGGPDCLVPLDIAATSPEEVQLFVRKQEIARACWARLH